MKRGFASTLAREPRDLLLQKRRKCFLKKPSCLCKKGGTGNNNNGSQDFLSVWTQIFLCQNFEN
jgi:hypothetical protein